ncbi:MAG: LD-carboxypeptidase, partial [Planctomycetota bacterium]
MLMNRRQMFGATSLLALTSPAAAWSSDEQNGREWLAPPALRAGDTVMFVAPAGPVEADKVGRARKVFEAQGLQVIVPPGLASRRKGYLAGDDSERLQELNSAIADPDVAGVFPIRGGYGMTRILDRIDYEELRKQPKIVAGFSDITALQLAIAKKSRVISFHSPMPQYNLYDKDPNLAEVTNSFWDTLLHERYSLDAEGYEVKIPAQWPSPKVLVGGTAKGRLTGGNLTLINATLGTPFQIDARDSILFFEDVDEAPYRIDRYLSQLRLAGILDEVSGVVVGTLTGAREKESQAQGDC